MSDMFPGGPGQRPVRPQRPAPSGRSRVLFLLLLAGVVLFVAFSGFASFWTEKLWFASMGYADVFSVLLWTRLGLFLVFGGLMAASVALNLALAYRMRPVGGPSDPNLIRYRQTLAPLTSWLLGGVSAMLGAFAGVSASGQWREFSLWRNSASFGTKDPYFDRDAGFYVFDLPWWHFVVDFAMVMLLVSLMGAVLVHYVYGGIRLSSRHDRWSGAAQVHISVLLGLFVLVKGADYWLDRFDLVTTSGGLFSGMGYTDDHAVLPAREILTGIALVCAVLFFLNIWRRTWLLPSLGIALLALSSVLLGLIVPGVVQQFQVKPSEPEKEGPYIAANIEATRTAYNLDGVDVTSYTSQPNTSGSDLNSLDGASASVPLVDPKVVSQTFEQLQQERAYYSVSDVLDVDRYDIEGKDRALVLGVRELDQNGLADGDKNWSNLHTVYTHGSGVIAAYANQRPADDRRQQGGIQWAEGQASTESALTELSPDGYETRIYYGEKSPSYSIVGAPSGSTPREVDLPKTDADADELTTYDGRGGVPVGSTFRQLLYAMKFGDSNIVLSNFVNDESKILYDRNPATMVEKVAPWLTLDSDPYPAVIDGRVQWLIDGYTVTDRYPLSQRESLETMTEDSLNQTPGFQTLPTDEINYMRNAVKATVDAYDGTVRIYAWDEEDPILRAWSKVFPGVVLPKSEMPDSLVEHVRYPSDLFQVQRYQLARYHVTDAKNWYDGANRWQVPSDPENDETLQPSYRLFDNDTWSLTSVFVPRGKKTLASYVSVNSDAMSSDYGKMSVLELSNERTDGPGQIANALQNDEGVRTELLGYSQDNGVRRIFGNLLTLPVGDGLMYVQPFYSQSTNDEASYPILRKVLVSYGDKIGIGDSLREAIADVLGVSADDPAPTEPDPDPEDGTDEGEPDRPGTVNEQIRDLLAQAEAKFAAADRAQASGDTVRWAQLTEEGRDLISEAVALADQSG